MFLISVKQKLTFFMLHNVQKYVVLKIKTFALHFTTVKLIFRTKNKNFVLICLILKQAKKIRAVCKQKLFVFNFSKPASLFKVQGQGCTGAYVPT